MNHKYYVDDVMGDGEIDICLKDPPQEMGNPVMVATVMPPDAKPGYPMTIDEAEKLARLFAAAPELLEACKQALRWIESDETTHNRLYGTGNALRAAIEAATGVRQIPPVDPPEDVCEKCGEQLTGHEDESATHCRWCVTCQDTTDVDSTQSTGEER